MKKHAVDGVSLAVGLVFLSFVVWWALFQLVRTALPGVGWVIAVGLVVAGLIGLIGVSRFAVGDRPASPADRSARQGPAG